MGSDSWLPSIDGDSLRFGVALWRPVLAGGEGGGGGVGDAGAQRMDPSQYGASPPTRMHPRRVSYNRCPTPMSQLTQATPPPASTPAASATRSPVRALVAAV